MKNAKNTWIILLCTAAMLALILDSKTAATGAAEGIALCLKTAIPSLFPMMVLSDIVTSRLSGRPIPGLKRLRSGCGIPNGAEGIFLAGLVGGYPIGAKCISQAYNAGMLSRQDAEHMLRFCSNAGPAFIFGICTSLFSSPFAPWLLWIIHILSAISIGIVYHNRTTDDIPRRKECSVGITSALANSVKTMGIVCGWIVLFRVIIRFLQAWLLWLFPPVVGVVFSGILELTNGCCMLNQTANEQLRFVLCSVLLAFGGLCVTMQTAAVAKGLSIKTYFKGKLLQTIFSILFALPTASLLFRGTPLPALSLYIIALCTVPIILHYFKKTIAFHRQMIYNTAKQ